MSRLRAVNRLTYATSSGRVSNFILSSLPYILTNEGNLNAQILIAFESVAIDKQT